MMDSEVCSAQRISIDPTPFPLQQAALRARSQGIYRALCILSKVQLFTKAACSVVMYHCPQACADTTVTHCNIIFQKLRILQSDVVKFALRIDCIKCNRFKVGN